MIWPPWIQRECGRLCQSLLVVLLLVPLGCDLPSRSSPDLVWGVHGVKPGRLHKPRVAAFDALDRLYLADLTDRIQVFDRDGKYLRGWRTPEFNVDGPSGLTIDRSAACWWPTPISIACSFTPRPGTVVPDRRRRTGDDTRPVWLSDRRRDRPGGQLLRRRVRRERPDPGFLARAANGSASGAATATSRANSSGHGHWPSTSMTGCSSPIAATTASRSSTRRESCSWHGGRGGIDRAR